MNYSYADYLKRKRIKELSERRGIEKMATPQSSHSPEIEPFESVLEVAVDLVTSDAFDTSNDSGGDWSGFGGGESGGAGSTDQW